MKTLLASTASHATDYLARLPDRAVFPQAGDIELLENLGGPLPESPTSPQEVMEKMARYASPATVASAGPRYFGFVVGGVLPAALAANWLAGAWDQNAGAWVMSPAAARLEQVALDWLVDLLGLPPETGAGFVTGATMANFTGLAAARQHLLDRLGWDVTTHGLYGAPEIQVVVGEEVHVSLLKSLSLLGFGSQRVTRVPADDQGRMRPDRLPELDDRTILCLQAGNVNSGAFDPAAELIPLARQAGAWVHTDGAFGLWALASPELAPLASGFEQADSIATDAHKWLNVPYDSGIAFVRQPTALQRAMAAGPAAYLDGMAASNREPDHYTPDMSRRARGVEIWAALQSLGRSGLAEMVERCCRLARQMADGLQESGFDVLNEVVLNQVVVSFGSPEHTREVIRRVQEGGEMWAGSTVWQGRAGMRLSVSNWSTTQADIARSLEAIRQSADRV